MEESTLKEAIRELVKEILTEKLSYPLVNKEKYRITFINVAERKKAENKIKHKDLFTRIGEKTIKFTQYKAFKDLLAQLKLNENVLTESVKKYLFGHDSINSAYIIDDYPYGFNQRTQKKVWIETKPKKGDRMISQTLNPKTQRWNKPKASTFSNTSC